MIRLTSHALLLAQDNRLESLSRGFRDRKLDFDSSNAIRVVLILVASAFVAWLISYFFTGDRRRRCNSPWRLFFTLCRAHRLRWRESWLLWRVARSQRLADPACLFLEPKRLAVENLTPALRPRAETLSLLRQRLFAGQKPEQSAQREDQEASKQAGPPPSEPAATQSGGPTWQSPGAPTLDIPPWGTDPRER